MRSFCLLRESKIFDPLDPSTPAHGSDLLDARVTHRNERWWMVLSRQAKGYGATDLYRLDLRGEHPYLQRSGSPFGMLPVSLRLCPCATEALRGTAEADGIAL